MTSEHPPELHDPVGYKIPRALLPRLRAIRDYYRQQTGRKGVTLIESLERMTAECEARYGINRNP